jgi:hypothetical protein
MNNNWPNHALQRTRRERRGLQTLRPAGRVAELGSLGGMTRIAPITLLFALFWLVSSGCAHRSASVTSRHQSLDEMLVESDRAFGLEIRADVVIDYERPDDIRVRSFARSGGFISATDETLAAAIARITNKRQFAVVIIGKSVCHDFSEPQLCAKVDSIEAVVRALGFTRVVFQLASATSRPFPVYRE